MILYEKSVLIKRYKIFKIKGTVIYILNENIQKPLHLQLFEALKEEILTKREIGDKLPSIRKLASEHNISKTTVASAYSQLYAEGFIESKPKRGYFVSENLYKNIQTLHNNDASIKIEKNYKYDFFPAQLKKEDFPLKTWKRCFNKAVDSSLDFGAYGEGQGEFTLREEIKKYLYSLREVHCENEQIIICSGFSDAMSLVAKLLKNRFTDFGMEEPGYYVARKVFQEYGYKIKNINVTTDGIELASLQASQAKLIYSTPSHHYPTGVSIPIAQRLKLLNYIQSVNGFIIEDDYDSELAYYNRPIPSLQGLDGNDRVIYFGTFAKSLSPTLRVAYLVLPKQLLPLYKESYDAHFPRVAITTQKTLELFMREGHWERHLRKIRTINKKKHNLLKQLLQEKLKESFKIVAEGAGLAILIHPTVAFDWEKFKKLSEQNSIKIYLAKERSGGDFEAIRMGFGGFSEEELFEVIDAFSLVWKDAIL
jgi:GntR family transcriptional regulator/MocR family aminotransferase